MHDRHQLVVVKGVVERDEAVYFFGLDDGVEAETT